MYKKPLLLSLIIVLLAGGMYFAFLNKNFFLKNNAKAQVSEKKVLLSVFEKELEPIYGSPVRLYTPDVGIDAKIVEVGTDEKGGLEAPPSWEVLGWYSRSAEVGQDGNLIVDGHYDDSHGRPAAFWNLKNFEPGDKVYLVDFYGRAYVYQVTEVLFLDITDPNRLEVLGSEEGKASLTLITCGGVWLTNKSTYDKRLVVRADRV